MNALPEYVSPVPAVVVAPLDTTPPNTASPPLERFGSESVPIEARVDDEYPNDPRVVDEFVNVCSAVNVLAVYVFGIVVEAAMYALIALFCVVASIVRAPPTLDSPEPRSEVKVEPFRMKFVVDAVVNDPYVVDEKLNLFTPENVFASPNSVDEANVHVDVENE